MSPALQQAPNITLGNRQDVGFATRTGLQLITGNFMVEGIELFGLIDFSEDQSKWVAGFLTILIAFIQNFFEARRNRRFIGAAPIPATLPEEVPPPIPEPPLVEERVNEEGHDL